MQINILYVCVFAFRCNRGRPVHRLHTGSLHRPVEVHGVATTTVANTDKPWHDFCRASVSFCWHTVILCLFICLSVSHVWTLYPKSRLTWSALYAGLGFLHSTLTVTYLHICVFSSGSTARWGCESSRSTLREARLQQVILCVIATDRNLLSLKKQHHGADVPLRVLARNPGIGLLVAPAAPRWWETLFWGGQIELPFF